MLALLESMNRRKGETASRRISDSFLPKPGATASSTSKHKRASVFSWQRQLPQKENSSHPLLGWLPTPSELQIQSSCPDDLDGSLTTERFSRRFAASPIRRLSWHSPVPLSSGWQKHYPDAYLSLFTMPRYSANTESFPNVLK
jgi:hypothetical protein